MNWIITYADSVLYDSGLGYPDISQGKLELDLYKAGSLALTIHPGHPHYDFPSPMKNIAVVWLGEREVFRGRLAKAVIGYKKEKNLVFESELAFFNDSYQEPFTYTGTPSGLLSLLITRHNRQVGEPVLGFNYFDVGSVEVHPDETITFTLEEYSTTFAVLDHIREMYGGYFAFVTPEGGGARRVHQLGILFPVRGKQCTTAQEILPGSMWSAPRPQKSF